MRMSVAWPLAAVVLLSWSCSGRSTRNSSTQSGPELGEQLEPCRADGSCEAGLECVLSTCRVVLPAQGSGGMSAGRGGVGGGFDHAGQAGSVAESGGGGEAGEPPSYRPMPNPPPANLPNPAAYTHPAPSVVRDELTQLSWQSEPLIDVPWMSAPLVCEELELGGRYDWRLPSPIELVTLLDFTILEAGATMLDLTVFAGAPEPIFWSLQHPVYTAQRWVVHFSPFNLGSSNGTASVRCVAGEPFAPRYQLGTDDLADTAHDSVTGLTWQRTMSEQKVTWQEAKAACASLSLAGREDWRLPSIKELLLTTEAARGEAVPDASVFGGDGVALWSSSSAPFETWHAPPTPVEEMAFVAPTKGDSVWHSAIHIGWHYRCVR